LLFIFDCLSTPFVKICEVGEKCKKVILFLRYLIIEEAEEATLQLLPAKSREHYEKVFFEFNECKEKRGVMTINEEVIDLRLYFSLSH
jgi:hypothetical protein